jgi:hypothetical protein
MLANLSFLNIRERCAKAVNSSVEREVARALGASTRGVSNGYCEVPAEEPVVLFTGGPPGSWAIDFVRLESSPL